MKTPFAIILLFFALGLYGQTPSGDQILKKIDQNMSSDNRVSVSKMIIKGKRGTRTMVSKNWAVGDKKSFSEYLSPAREKGTKMLKLEDHLWMYSPSTDRIIQISGHMLRQSVMGSDLSYEDMMEDKTLRESYHAAVTGEDTLDKHICWVLELTAKSNDLAYQMRKLWVDKKIYVPIREELYAKSGTLLKKMELKDIKNVNGRWFPRKMIFKDMLKTGSGTEFIIEDIQFNVEIPDYIFSKAALRK